MPTVHQKHAQPARWVALTDTLKTYTHSYKMIAATPEAKVVSNIRPGAMYFCLPRPFSCRERFEIPSRAADADTSSLQQLNSDGSVANRYKRLQRKTLHLTGIASRGHRDEPMVQFRVLYLCSGEPGMGPSVVEEPFVRPGLNRSNGGVSGSWRGSCTYLQQIRGLGVSRPDHACARSSCPHRCNRATHREARNRLRRSSHHCYQMQRSVGFNHLTRKSHTLGRMKPPIAGCYDFLKQFACNFRELRDTLKKQDFDNPWYRK